MIPILNPNLGLKESRDISKPPVPWTKILSSGLSKKSKKQRRSKYMSDIFFYSAISDPRRVPFLQQLWLVRFSCISSSAETEALPSKVHAANRASSFCAIWSWGRDSNQHRYVLRYNLVLSLHTVFFSVTTQ